MGVSVHRMGRSKSLSTARSVYPSIGTTRQGEAMERQVPRFDKGVKDMELRQ